MMSALRSDLDRIRIAALRAVDPALAVRRNLQLLTAQGQEVLQVAETSWKLAHDTRVQLLAVGKAAIPMAEAAGQILGARLEKGLVIAPHGYSSTADSKPQLMLVEAGHPVPDATSVKAAGDVEGLLSSADAKCRLLVLLSGGASALLAAPSPGLTLEDLQTATAQLLRSGASIQELNAIRKHTDRLKGGQLASLAPSTPLATLILSDVIGDRLDVIASGLTVGDPSTFADCLHILERYELIGRVPASIEEHIRRGVEGHLPETPKPGDRLIGSIVNTIVGSNRLAAEAASAEASQLGYHSMVLDRTADGEAREAGVIAAAMAQDLRLDHGLLPRPGCIVMGGETTVTVRGNGKGGRNQELALSAALHLQGLADFALMAFATDGIDGPTDAAGAIIDGETIAAGQRLGLDAKSSLENNDAYHYLKAAGALIFSGPTHTNVNDLVVIVAR